jgi:hypothetical protein
MGVPEGGWVLFAVDAAGMQVVLEPADRTRFRWQGRPSESESGIESSG